MSMQFVGAGKVLFHATDETYLWSRHRGSKQHYSRYWIQAIRSLCHAQLEADREPVEVSTDSPRYLQGQTVRLRVCFHDDRLAPAGDDAVVVTVEDEEGQRLSMPLNRLHAIRGEFATVLPDVEVGNYKVRLATPAVEQSSSIHFTVTPSNGELVVLEMNAAKLKEAARISGGRFRTIETADRLPASLPRGTQIRIERLPPEAIWNSPWIAALFVAFLATEWTLRKRIGLL